MLLLIALACQKIREDKLGPQIKLLGRNPDTLLLGCAYVDSGAEVFDDYSGASYSVEDLTIDTLGTYYLEYLAIDLDSNRTYAYRTIVVASPDPEFFIDTYAVSDTSRIPVTKEYYQATISRTSENPNVFKIANFNNLGEASEMLIQPDSTGAFDVDYENADTSYSGSGYVKCDYSGLFLEYDESADNFYMEHKAHYQKK